MGDEHWLHDPREREGHREREEPRKREESKKRKEREEQNMADPPPEILITEATVSTEGEGTKPPNSNQMFSDQQLILEEFDPIPYVFILRDANGVPLALPPNIISNARFDCPKFYVLLDHLMAVLWCYYSKKGLDLLGSSQLHWALKILEGTQDKFGQYTEDINMAMDHLREAFIDVCAACDVEKLEDRKYTSQLESTRRGMPPTGEQKSVDSVGYEDFERQLYDPENIHSGSIHLDDMVATRNPEAIIELLHESKEATEKELLAEEVDVQTDNEENIRETVVSWRDDQFRRIINQLEEIQRIDSTLRGLKCQSNAALTAKLNDMLKRQESRKEE